VAMSVAQNIELFTHALSGITIIFIPDKESNYRTVRLSTGHLETLNAPCSSWIFPSCAFLVLSAAANNVRFTCQASILESSGLSVTNKREAGQSKMDVE